MRSLSVASLFTSALSLASLGHATSDTCDSSSSSDFSEKCSGTFKTKCANANYPCADISFSKSSSTSSTVDVTLSFSADNCLSTDYLSELKIIGLHSPDVSTVVLYSRNSKVYDIEDTCNWSKTLTLSLTDNCISQFQIQYDWFSAGADSQPSSWTYASSYDYLIDCVVLLLLLLLILSPHLLFKI
ncbi:unnamed protein product [Ambrosiozyma monospora]|uniref:Unnamed protein product n=1 Tax=Ambrosiozyma monospora TaxID=43982 RepID=A0A9W6T1A9_AMBMO|nr:unnamed protein product [Ambrosiozyma monospora]